MSKHILVADDEASFRFAASLFLRQKGYEVSQAKDGLEALAQITNRQEQGMPYDLLVLDIQMPGMTGIEVFDAINENGVTTPVVFVSGYTDDQAMRTLNEKTNSILLKKPFESQQMIQLVELMMSSR
jgi:CheY-like chemotaxis protein